MDEKLIDEFISLGCKDRVNASVCLQVYLDLCEVKRYWNVKYFYNKDVDTIYLTCKRSKSEPESSFVPCCEFYKLSFGRMKEFLSLDKSEHPRVYLVFVSGDSTLVYYQIEDGIGPPKADKPQTSRDETRESVDLTLRKHRKLIEQSALYGLPITLPKKQEASKKDPS